MRALSARLGVKGPTATSYDPDQQHEIMTEIFIDGLHAQLARRRQASP